MSKMKTLCEYLAEGDYSAFLRFVHSNNVLGVTEADECEFYRNATKCWAKTLLNWHAPSQCVERVIVTYQPEDLLSFLDIKWHLYPQTLLWAFNEAPTDVAEKVLNVLQRKPDRDVEMAMLKRGELELFKTWLDKFHSLDEESEALINDDVNLSSLKSYYIDRMIRESL